MENEVMTMLNIRNRNISKDAYQFSIMENIYPIAMMLLLVIALIPDANAAVRSSANYSIQQDVISSGAVSSTSTNYSLSGLLGQPITGAANSTNYSVISGFVPLADDPNADSDSDGVLDSVEDLDSDGNLTEHDTDNDTIPNYLDTDDDGDGYLTSVEGDQTVDTDGDGTPDYLDDDSDGDGVRDEDELNTDSDSDGLNNRIDNDDDGDGYLTQNEDTNGNGNPADDSTDGPDGIPDYLDLDSDGDGMPDAYEFANGLNRVGNDANIDSDGDGFSNIDEFNAGTAANDINDFPATAENDFNGDDIDDVLWRRKSNGALIVQLMNTSGLVGTEQYVSSKPETIWEKIVD